MSAGNTPSPNLIQRRRRGLSDGQARASADRARSIFANAAARDSAAKRLRLSRLGFTDDDELVDFEAEDEEAAAGPPKNRPAKPPSRRASQKLSESFNPRVRL